MPLSAASCSGVVSAVPSIEATIRTFAALNQREYHRSKGHSERFLVQLRERPWLQTLIWLGPSSYSLSAEALALNNLGAAELALGEFDSARAHLNQAIARDPRCPLPCRNMGTLTLRTSSTAEAMPWFEKAAALKVSEEMLKRALNVGFSGGEKKRLEILQMALFQPSLAVLDETDSGLDIDALKLVAEGVNALRAPDRAMLVITHYQRLLDYIVPDRIHVLAKGRIVKEGGKELAHELEAKGYEQIVKDAA